MTTILRRSAHRSMPWRNGGGVTLEAIREPADAEDFAWRLSFAQVTGSGPFSRFDGYDRVIALVEGDRMRLTDRDSGALLADLGLHEPYAFAGESPIDSEITSPGLDVNVMTRRADTRAEVEILQLTDPRGIDSPAGGEALLAVLAGEVELLEEPGGSGDPVRLATLDVARDLSGSVVLRPVEGVPVVASIRIVAV